MTGPAAAVPVPIRLPLNGFPHFYRGGARIAAFRGLPASAVPGPEDWVGSTVTRFGEPRLGLTVLPDGRTLRDAVAADPRAWLGSEHVARFGADPALLVKLLDAGQRLVVHAHPDRDFARRHLDCPHGKTEAWVVVETAGPGATVYLGFREEIPEGRLREWVRDQRTDLLLGALNEVRLRAAGPRRGPAVRRQCGDGRAERGGAGPYRGGRLHRGHCGRDPAGAAAGAGRAALRKRPGWCARARWQPC